LQDLHFEDGLEMANLDSGYAKVSYYQFPKGSFSNTVLKSLSINFFCFPHVVIIP